MTTIIYLSNKSIQVVEGSPSGKKIILKAVHEGETPANSIINGVITDEEAFVSWLKDFFSRNRINKKNVTLVINSSQMISKVLSIPKVRVAEAMQLLPREFGDIRSEDAVFTYYTITEDPGNKMQHILATAVERYFIESYLNLFKQVGIEIASVDSALSCVVRLLMRSDKIQKKTCIVQLFDGLDLVSILFVKGRYYYSQRNRLFAEKGTEKFVSEICEIVNRILQFVTAQQIQEPVTELFLCGDLREELVKFRFESVMEQNSISPEAYTLQNLVLVQGKALKFKKEIGRFLYPIGYFIETNTHIDLGKQVKQNSKANQKNHERKQLILPVAIAMGVCLVVTLGLGYMRLQSKMELSSLQKQIEQEQTESGQVNGQITEQELQVMQQKLLTADTIWSHLQSYPTMSSKVETALQECANEGVILETKSFQRDSGVLTIAATASDVMAINVFIGNLQKQELFEAVEYNGYTYSKGQGNYIIHVVCSLKSGAGKK